MPITISIADDHPMMIDGVSNLLAQYPHLKLIGSYLNAASLLAGLELLQPNILLLDIQLPDKNGDELTPIIRKKFPNVKILILTNFDSGLYANNMLKLGVNGYLLKTSSKEVLLKALETVDRGELFLQKSIEEKIIKLDYNEKRTVFSKNTLTVREKEILKLIVDGCTSQEIASCLFLSVNTVVNYRTNIMLKLDAKNMAILVQRALKWGLID